MTKRRHRYEEPSFEVRYAAASMLLGLRADFPTHIKDQSDAAVRDASSAFGGIAEALQLQRPDQFDHEYPAAVSIKDPALVAHATALAAVLSCMHEGRACRHLRKAHGPQPTFADLRTRRLVCKSCLPSVLPGLVPPVVPDDECDICGALVPDNTFWPVAGQLGATVILGDSCRSCAQRMGNPLARQR